VAQGEEEADAQRPAAFVHQLAGGVVDRRDVVGIEGVPQPEGVGQHAGAHPERRPRVDPVVPPGSQGQQRETEQMHPEDRTVNPGEAAPLGR